MTARRHLRIALVSGDFADDGRPGLGGGIESYVRAMSRALAAAGHDVHVIARGEFHTYERVAGEGERVHAVHTSDEWPDDAADLGEARGALTFAWHAWRQVRTLVAASGPFDVVEAPEYKAQGYYLGRDATLPLVVKCHAHLKLCLELNDVPLSSDTALLVDLEAETLSRAVAIHANSRALAERCSRDYGLAASRIVHVPYGIDVDRFRPTPSTLRADWRSGDGPVLLYAGRLERRKGIDTLVEAFARLTRDMPDATLVVAGGDTFTSADGTGAAHWMQQTLAAAGVPADRVRMLGPVAPNDMPALYSAADVMVAPSPFEAFGLVYLEAMACGTAVIGCAAGGVPEIVTDGVTGSLVRPSDASALSAAMAGLLGDTDRRRRMAAAARQVVQHDYSLEAVVRRTEAFYHALPSRHGRVAA